MASRRLRDKTLIGLQSLENRVNPGLVTNVMDYDPNPLSPNGTPIMGSLRYEVVQVLKAGGGAVEFNTDSSKGVVFGDPANPQTINLKYGELSIIPALDAQQQNLPLASVFILGPRYLDLSKDYVTINWQHWGSLNEPGQDSYGSDWSVIDADLTEDDDDEPGNGDKLVLGGLRLTGGKAFQGAGLNITGYLQVDIVNTMIAGNTAMRHDPEDFPDTRGAGIHTTGTLSYDLSVRTFVTFGPLVRITDSIISSNTTDVNNDDPLHVGIDVGGGMYLGAGTRLVMSGSLILSNIGENGAGGIFFEGGQVDSKIFEDKKSQDAMAPTWATIDNCMFLQNRADSTKGGSAGGAIIFAGPMGALISDTSFDFNFADGNGGAIQLRGQGEPITEGDVEYVPAVGEVVMVACTLEGNMAANGPEAKPPEVIPEYGTGGAISVDGIVNDFRLFNSTVSANKVISGKDGGIALRPQSFKHSVEINLGEDLNAQTITLDGTVVIAVPDKSNATFRLTRTDIGNTTIANNLAEGKVHTDGKLYGARGGGLSIRLDLASSPMDGHVSVFSTIVGDNKIAPAFDSITLNGGFGTDLYAADKTGTGIVISDPPGGPSGMNLTEISNDGWLSLGGQSGTYQTPLDPQLLPLNNYGGMVRTHALRFSNANDHSPAIDLGINPLLLSYDARGSMFKREVDVLGDTNPQKVDVGAYELQEESVLVEMITWADSDNGNSFPNSRSRITRIELRFSQAVTIPIGPANAAFKMATLPLSANDTISLTPAINPTQTSINLTFNDHVEAQDKYHSLVDGNYHLRVLADKITSYFGVPIDGNADGIVGGDFVTAETGPEALYRLFGESGIGGFNRSVTAIDFNEFRLFYGKIGETGVPVFDFNGDNMVTAIDFNEFRLRYGVTLPTP